MAYNNALNAGVTGIVTATSSGVFTGTTVTQYYTLVGAASNGITSIAPSATAGIPLVSGGSAANPSYTTAVVAGGGTGNTTFTAYSIIAAGTTATGAFQNVVGVGSSGQVLTSNGAAALPTWQAVPMVATTWTDKAVSFNAAAANGYFITATSVAATLPASPSQGATISFGVAFTGSASLAITANTGQVIQLGSSASSSGGTMTNTALGDSCVLVYHTADTTWYCIGGPQGNWTLA